ncbi:MAG: hypothetical protein AABX47_08355 [Nanoarchaeota archaeon]
MILIIDVCESRLHRFEFVKPIEDIVRGMAQEFITKRFIDIEEADLTAADKVIICGTSLKDDCFLRNLDRFDWIKTLNKPILGVCAGFQIIGLVFDGTLNKKTEIGFFKECIDILGVDGEQEVYHLHNNYVDFPKKTFDILSKSDIPQAVKHKELPIYGVLFHPEVRQRVILENFIRLE